MSALRELISAHAPVWLACGGFGVGLAFGAIAFATNFCTMGAVFDIVNLGDWRRFRAWLLAAATAVLGAQVLQAMGVVELSQSMYLAPRLNWLGSIGGGLMFGFGMALAGGCVSRNLIRVGAGDLRSLMVLVVLGIVAYATMGGLLGPVRAAIEQATAIALPAPTQGINDILAAGTGLPAASARAIAAGALVIASAVYCFKDAEFRASPVHIVSGLAVGLCVVAGWALTGLAFDELSDHPAAPICLTFVRPTGDAIDWLERYTATPFPGFGAASVFGTIAGAFAVALKKRRFRISTFAGREDTLRNLLGAVLMGVGGVLALGCSIGQAVTGVSTLALSSLLVFAVIVVGCLYGIRTLERWLSADA